MKYFRVFDHTSSYTEYMSSEDAVIPNVSYCCNDNKTYITTLPPAIQYRWINLDPAVDYYCDGETYTKYYKQQRQQSEDGGVTWTNVDPAEYRQGDSAETMSTDCGYVPPQYQWVNIDPSVDYYCNSETFVKYYKQQQQVSYDGGTTWENVTPAVYQQGGVAEVHSTDCGYVPAKLVIQGASTVSAESCSYKAIGSNVSDVTTAATWSITAGSQYATINSSGQVTILAGASESQVTIQAVFETLTATTTVTLTYVSGATSETTTDIVIDENGNTTTVVTTVTENEDGSSSETTETVITDESGNTVGSSESNKGTNADGSYTGNTVNYDANGDPVDGVNVSGDTDSNVSTQTVEFDETGGTVVTGYEIDTSGNPDGSKAYNQDGVNTEYYAFDVTRGFVVDINFTIDFANQPTGQNENHHNILTAKRATPSPWYGFQLRQTGTNTYIILGTQFATGSNTNTTISGQSLGNNVYEYNLTITYDPTVSTNSFVCYNNLTQANVYRSNLKFPDIEELKYLKVVIGYAMNENGDPYRYSNINVKNFNLRRT